MSSLWHPSPKESPILGLTGMWGGVSSGLLGSAETPGRTDGGAFNHQSSGDISGSWGGHSRTAYAFNNFGSINYGTQNGAPFNTSTDWNNDITRAYGNTVYSSRTHAASMVALMKRPSPQGGFPISGNNWESAWWVTGNNSNSDILVCVFSAIRTLDGIQISNPVAGNTGNETIYAGFMEGTSSSWTMVDIGNVSWQGATGDVATIPYAGTAQAIAVWRAGNPTWGRIEAIRFLK